MADFRTRTPAIDPMAFANVLQRKAQMEQEQKNLDRKRKDDQINNIMNAVVQGQTIASNMMTLAEKRSQTKGLNDLTALVESPEPQAPTPMASSSALADKGTFAVQPSPEQMQGHQDVLAQRQRDFASALVRANPDEATKAAIKDRFNPSSEMKGKEQVHYLTLDDGSTVVARFDTTGEGFKDINGSPLSEDVMRRVVNRTYAGQFLEDPTTGVRQFGNKSTGQVAPAESDPNVNLGDLSNPDNALINLRTKAPKVYEKVSTILEGTSPAKNAKLETLVASASSSAAAKAILLDPKPSEVGLASLGFHMARSSGSNSQLSDAERETFQEPLAFLEKVKNKGWKFVAGDLSPKMRQDLLRLNTLLERKSTIQANRMITTEKRRARLESGALWNDGLDKAFPDVKSLIAEASEMVPEDVQIKGAEKATIGGEIDSLAKVLGLPRKKKTNK